MLQIVFTNRMKHDVKLMQKRGKNLDKLIETLNLLVVQTGMPEKYRDHHRQPVPTQTCFNCNLRAASNSGELRIFCLCK